MFEAREQMLEFNVPPLLALESMMVALRVAGLTVGFGGDLSA